MKFTQTVCDPYPLCRMTPMGFHLTFSYRIDGRGKLSSSPLVLCRSCKLLVAKVAGLMQVFLPKLTLS